MALKTQSAQPFLELTAAVQACLDLRQFAQASALVEAKWLLTPQHPHLLYLQGVIAYFQGSLKLAIEKLCQALQLNSTHTDAAVCLSVLYNDIGKYEEAKKIFEQANHSVTHSLKTAEAEIHRKFSVKHLELADLYFRYRRYDEAIEEYTKAAQLDPHHFEVRIKRAKAFAKKGFLSRAVSELNLLKQEEPGHLAVRIQLGLLHFSQGNLLDAELEWEAVLDSEPTHREAGAYLEMAKKARSS